MTHAPKRRWLRYSLRTLFIALTILCIGLGVEESRVLKQNRIASTVRALGGDVFLGYRFDASGRPKEFSKRTLPSWLTNFISEDYFATIVTVNFDNDFGKRPSDRSKARGSQVTDEDLSLLDDTPNVRELLLASNFQLTDECLAHAAGLKHLRVLTLNQTNVKGPGLRHIQSLQDIKGLTLNDTPLTDEGLSYLKHFPKIEWLFVGNTAISDEGLSHLASLKSLRALELTNTIISDHGLQYLKELKGLTRLSLAGTAVTDAGRDELRRALPKCTISK